MACASVIQSGCIFNLRLIKGSASAVYQFEMDHLVDLGAILVVALVFLIANRPRRRKTWDEADPDEWDVMAELHATEIQGRRRRAGDPHKGRESPPSE